MVKNPKIQDLLNPDQIQQLKNSLSELANALICDKDYLETENTPIDIKVAHEYARTATINSLFDQLSSSPLWNASRTYYFTFNEHLNSKSKIKLINLLPAIIRYNNHNINWIKVCKLLGFTVYSHGITENKEKDPRQAKIITGWAQYDTNQIDLFSDNGSYWRIGPHGSRYTWLLLPYPYAPLRDTSKRRY